MSKELNMKDLEIGPYIRRTKLFDEFYGYYHKNKKDVVIQIFPYIYNLQEASIERIKTIHDKLNDCEYVQKRIGYCKDRDTGIVSLVFQNYPKSNFSLPEKKSDFFTKFIPSFIYKGILCLQSLNNCKICHHDICLENIYFGNPIEKVEIPPPDELKAKKDENKDPINFDFRLLNFTFATFDNHDISITPRYKYNNKLFKKDPYLRDIWDFGITIFSLIDKEKVPVLINRINDTEKKEFKWDELLKNYHQYREHCKKVKLILEKIFSNEKSSSILTNLIFNDVFSLDFFQSEKDANSGLF